MLKRARDSGITILRDMELLSSIREPPEPTNITELKYKAATQ